MIPKKTETRREQNGKEEKRTPTLKEKRRSEEERLHRHSAVFEEQVPPS